MKIAVFVSGGGTNLQSIIDAVEEGTLSGVKIVRVIGSLDGIYALERAKKHNIPYSIIKKRDFCSQNEYDTSLINELKQDKPDLIVLAGFLSLLGSDFIKEYENKIINVHPSLIPAFCGKGMFGIKPHEEALKRGVKITGATVHMVDKNYDCGPIIFQKPVIVKDDDTPEILQKRVMEQAEHILIVKAIDYFMRGKIKIKKNKTELKK